MLKSQPQSATKTLGSANDPRAQTRIARAINAVINDADLASKYSENMMIVKERTSTALEEFAAHYTDSPLSLTDMNDWIKASVFNVKNGDRISLLITRSAILSIEDSIDDRDKEIVSSEGKIVTKLDPFPLSPKEPEFKPL